MLKCPKAGPLQMQMNKTGVEFLSLSPWTKVEELETNSHRGNFSGPCFFLKKKNFSGPCLLKKKKNRLHPIACGNLLPWWEIEPASSALEGGILTIGLLGKPLALIFFLYEPCLLKGYLLGTHTSLRQAADTSKGMGRAGFWSLSGPGPAQRNDCTMEVEHLGGIPNDSPSQSRNPPLLKGG